MEHNFNMLTRLWMPVLWCFAHVPCYLEEKRMMEMMVALAPPRHVSSLPFLQGRAKFIFASRYGPQVDAGRLTTLRQGEPPYCHHLLQG